MPSNFLTADTGFPRMEGMSDREKLAKIESYLYQLLEQLRYTLNNLGANNFNDAELKDIGKTITEPVHLALQDAEKGFSNALTITAQGLSSQISNVDGRVSTLSQTAEGLSSRVQNAEGSLSTLSQTVNSLSLSVQNGSASSTIRLMANGVSIASQNIQMSGMVTFTDLSTEGATTIHGGSLMTGTVKATMLQGEVVNLYAAGGLVTVGTISLKATESYAMDIRSNLALRLQSGAGYNAYLANGGNTAYVLAEGDGTLHVVGKKLLVSGDCIRTSVPTAAGELNEVVFVLEE